MCKHLLASICLLCVSCCFAEGRHGVCDGDDCAVEDQGDQPSLVQVVTSHKQVGRSPKSDIDGRKVTYNPEVARKAALLYSSAAYCPKYKIEAWPQEFVKGSSCYNYAETGTTLLGLQQHGNYQSLSQRSSEIPIDAHVMCYWGESWCSGAQCCPRVEESGNLTYPCPNAPRDFDKCETHDPLMRHEILTVRYLGDKPLGIVVKDDMLNAVVVSFMGTNKTGGLIRDASGGLYVRRPCVVKGTALPGYVHKSFCQYYNVLVNEGFDELIIAAVKANPDYDLLFTGHSLGAAAAGIAAVDSVFRMKLAPRQTLLYTFGEPRVGNYDFAHYSDMNLNASYRIVHKCDIVTALPPCCWNLGMCNNSDVICPYHVAQEIWYDNDMANLDKYTTCSATVGEDWKTCGCDLQVSIPDHLSYFNTAVGSNCCF